MQFQSIIYIFNLFANYAIFHEEVFHKLNI